MARFRFRLQRALEIRQRQEEVIELELAAAEARLRRLETRLRELGEHRDRTQEELKRAMQARLLIEELLRYQAYFHRLDREMDELAEQIRMAVRARNEVRARLIKARQKRRALEKLRERKVKLFKKSEEKADQMSIDETALSVSLRGRGPLPDETAGGSAPEILEPSWRAGTEGSEGAA